jgi:hypothetical protein
MLEWVPPPAPPQRNLSDAQFKGDVLVGAWRHRRGLPSQAHEDPSTLGLSQNALAYIVMEAERRRRSSKLLDSPLHEAMVELTPQLSQPHSKSEVESLGHVFAQPEMQSFWSAWKSARAKRARGPQASDSGAKAMACMLGMTKHSHGLSAYGDLYEKQRVRQLFAGAELAAARAKGEPDPDPLQLALYEGTMGRLKTVTRGADFRVLAMQTNAELFRALCELYPGRGFGERLLIDGCLFPAWCPQKGTGKDNPVLEAQRRRTTPHAGARHIQYTSTGKANLDPETLMSAGSYVTSSNFARGYFYIAIIDQASGWPLVSLVKDAAEDEADSLVPLLSDLYRYFDFIKPKLIAGDGAWDEEWAHRDCELFYGLAPVFRHTERSAGTTLLPAGASQSNSVKGFTHEGQLACMEHNKAMPFESFVREPRGDLRPGQGAHGHPDSVEFARELERRERGFRVRGLHNHQDSSAGHVSIQARLDWRRLNAYPRYSEGAEKLYAKRQALGMRLKNQMEGHFNRMQTGLCLATDGADRLRLQDWETVAALLQLGELRMNALSLAAERAHEGCAPPPLPDAPLGPLPVANEGGSRRSRSRPNAAVPTSNGSGGGGGVAACAMQSTRSASLPAPPPRRTVVASALPPSAALSPPDQPTLPDPVEEQSFAPATADANVIHVDFSTRRKRIGA